MDKLSVVEPENFTNNNVPMSTTKKHVGCICGQRIPVVQDTEEEETQEGGKVKSKLSWKNYWSQSLDKIQNGPLEKFTRIFTRKYGLFSGSYSAEMWDRNWEILSDTTTD